MTRSAIFTGLIFICISFLTAQDFPPTINVGITFYDHLSRDDDAATCAAKGYVEFNMCQNGGFQPNCVLPELGPNSTPVFNSANPQNNGCTHCCWYNQYVDEWYIDNSTKGANRKLPPNMVIQDSLVFTHLGDGMYEFNKAGWFPLDGRGLVAAGVEQGLNAGHNYGFTVHMHRSFLYTGTDIDDNVFIFRGDDDVWVFMNNHLVLDIGGIHTPVQDQFTFAEAKAIIEAAEGRNLIAGQDSIYFDFFYAERREVDANIRITTNMPIIVEPKLPQPRANPATSQFTFDTTVTITHIFSAPIFYSINGAAFQPYNGMSLRFTDATTLRAYSAQAGWRNSDTISEVYTPVAGKSQLVLRKSDGSQISSLTELTQNDVSFIVEITSPTAELEGTAQSVRYTTRGGDAVNFSTSPGINAGSVIKFSDTIPYTWNTAANPGNNALEVSAYDTITVSWTNPTDAADIVTGTVAIRPAAQPAAVYFTTTLDGTPLTADDSLAASTTQFYVYVVDQVFKPGVNYTVTLSNVPGPGDPVDIDILTLPLIATATPGKYYAAVPLDDTLPTAGDGRLQAIVGNQIRAEFTDPVDDGDNASAQIGFGVKSEKTGTLRFTNADYTTTATLVDGTWPLDNGSLYLVYTDDALITSLNKQCLVVVANHSPSGIYFDTVMVTLLNQGNGIWQAPVPLADSRTMVRGDNTLQIYFNGIVTAYVSTHQNSLNSEIVDGRVEASIQVAYSNRGEDIVVSDKGTGGAITRATTQVEVCVTDQIFSTTTVDTLYLNSVECTAAGDQIAGQIMLIQDNPTDSTYCGTITKSEGVGTPGNGLLECLDGDNMGLKYIDIVYNTGLTKDVPITDPFLTKIEFFDPTGTDTINTAVEAFGLNQFLVRVTTKDNHIGVADDTTITLTTPTGDQEIVLLRETAVPGVYEGLVTFGFAISPAPGNNVIQGKIIPGQIFNQEEITATLGSTTNAITIKAAYIAARNAYIIDGDHDGKGDTIFIEFNQPLPVTNPQELEAILGSISDIDWPTEEANVGTSAILNLTSGLYEIGIVEGSGNLKIFVIPGDYSTAYPQDATERTLNGDIPPKYPSLKLPDNVIFQGQEVFIEDRMGPVVHTAVKIPSDLQPYDDTTSAPDGSVIYTKKTKPDTLIITFSERFEWLSSEPNKWNTLLQFTKGACGEGLTVNPIILVEGIDPKPTTADSLTWQFLVSYDFIRPSVSDCIYMNPDALVLDSAGNAPERKGQNVEGNDPDLIIKFTGVLNAVEGAGYNLPRSSLLFDPAVNDPNSPDQFQPLFNDDGTIRQDAGGNDMRVKYWFTPVGFDPNTLTLNDATTQMEICKDPLRNETSTTDKVPYPPKCLSTVYVYALKPYIAKVQIFDHQGTFIHASTQQFGYCGEMNNDNRNYPKGWLSYLVWDLKDKDGKYVKNGVYIWKVTFNAENEAPFTNYYRQGTAFEQNPSEDCAVNPQF